MIEFLLVLRKHVEVDEGEDVISKLHPVSYTHLADGIVQTFAELEKQTAGEEMPGFYMVQTGIYRVRANAEREVEHRKSQGFPAFMTFKDGLDYVRAGSFRNMENAVRQEQELRKLGYPTLLVKT